MTTKPTRAAAAPWGRTMLNKVPEITIYFWIIKILCTTVGETASDSLDAHLNLGLTNTTLITGGALVITLFFQFRVREYIPALYWLSVVLISVVGTQITDNLTDKAGISLVTTTIVFSVVLALVFAAWFAVERTLSIHSILTSRREGFYWLAILFTFALGTAAGDLTAERLNLGYWLSALMFAGAIAVVAAWHLGLKLNAITAFWIAYVLTRPLGASLGDYLSQQRANGGLGIGTFGTSMIFLGTILAVVVFLTLTRRDRIVPDTPPTDEGRHVLPRVLLATNHSPISPAMLDAVRRRTAAGAAEFVLLVPNPDHHAFDRASSDLRHGEHLLADALPQLSAAAGATVEGRVSANPNAYDDIVAELAAHAYAEIILETPTAHLAHWIHVDLPQRLAHLGYPLTTVDVSHEG